LRTSSDTGELEETKVYDEEPLPKSRSRWSSVLKIAPWLAHLVFFLLSSTLLFKAREVYIKTQNLAGPPITHELGKSIA